MNALMGKYLIARLARSGFACGLVAWFDRGDTPWWIALVTVGALVAHDEVGVLRRRIEGLR